MMLVAHVSCDWLIYPKLEGIRTKKYHPIAEIILIHSQTHLCILCYLISTHFSYSNPECQPIGYFHPPGVFLLCQTVRFCQHASAFVSLTLTNTWQQFSHRTDPYRAPIGTRLQTNSPSFNTSCGGTSSSTAPSPMLQFLSLSRDYFFQVISRADFQTNRLNLQPF